MRQVREAFQAAVHRTSDPALQGSLYLLGVTRERSAHLVETVASPEVAEFAELLRGRDLFVVQTLAGAPAVAGDLKGSLTALQGALLTHVASRGAACTHWMTGEPTDVHTLVMELVEEESCRRGELTAALGVQESSHRF